GRALFLTIDKLSFEDDVSQELSFEALTQQGPADTEDTRDESEGRIHRELLKAMSVSLRMFKQDEATSNNIATDDSGKEVLEEAFNAFIRLQLVRKQACLLNNAMVIMRNVKGDLSSMFDWIYISSDTFILDKVDKKKVKDQQGTLFTPINAASKHANMLPETITDVQLQTLESSIGLLMDTAGKGEGKFTSILRELTCTKWTNQSLVLRSYDLEIPRNGQFLERLKSFALGLNGFPGNKEVPTGGLLVFRYTLVNSEHLDLFVRTLRHRHMPVTKARMDRVLHEIKSRRRMQSIIRLLNKGACQCGERIQKDAAENVRAHSAASKICYLFCASKDDHRYYYAHLYPHLAKVERLSTEIKVRYRGRIQFEFIVDGLPVHWKAYNHGLVCYLFATASRLDDCFKPRPCLTTSSRTQLRATR
ncbi:hypothetical protein GOODEAATRI_027110, partial [Goodea atripinnis]